MKNSDVDKLSGELENAIEEVSSMETEENNNGRSKEPDPLFEEKELKEMDYDQLGRRIRNEQSKKFRYREMGRDLKLERCLERLEQLMNERDSRPEGKTVPKKSIIERVEDENLEELEYEDLNRMMRNIQSVKSTAKAMGKTEKLEKALEAERIVSEIRDSKKPEGTVKHTVSRKRILNEMERLQAEYEDNPSDELAVKIETLQWVADL